MAQKLMASFFLGCSSIYLFWAQALSFGTIDAPKAGFLPILSGGIAILLSLVIFIQQLVQAKSEVIESVNWRKLVFVIIGLVFYVIFLNIVGYIVATFLILFYLLKVSDTPGWLIPGCTAAAITLTFYFLFENLLDITLP